jgi:hypothetical protein
MGNRVAIALVFVGLAGFAAFAAWAIAQASHLGGGWGDLAPVWPFVLGGALVVAALTGVLMWLAFYSARRGYDDAVDHDHR